MDLSLGIIETIGLSAAVEAADACLKSANVELIGYELTRGSGMVLIKVEGNVGAVKAAIDAAKVSAAKVGKVVGAHVIPRPSRQVDLITRSCETVGIEKEPDMPPEIAESHEQEAEGKTDADEKINSAYSFENKEESTERDLVDGHNEMKDDIKRDKEKSIDVKQKEFTCNICKDPKCTRKKGDLRSKCIHYKETKKDNK